MIVLNRTELRRIKLRRWIAGAMLGAALVTAIKPAAAPVIEDAHKNLACHWPKRPGEGMFVGLDGEGKRYCWEVGR